jgi:hypothetical protein
MNRKLLFRREGESERRVRKVGMKVERGRRKKQERCKNLMRYHYTKLKVNWKNEIKCELDSINFLSLFSCFSQCKLVFNASQGKNSDS